ncbi:hypothetical protein NDU88_002637 [Pleurodeles waltl]|uniref:Uncharacterized protein n=1 Tax=Pleurodeles waltl TaxID=8319 RepID=A0AAV7TL85_PLEWA|nr:hypothetical protein NDU88_002637 [Pleurodeles waltl]
MGLVNPSQSLCPGSRGLLLQGTRCRQQARAPKAEIGHTGRAQVCCSTGADCLKHCATVVDADKHMPSRRTPGRSACSAPILRVTPAMPLSECSKRSAVAALQHTCTHPQGLQHNTSVVWSQHPGSARVPRGICPQGICGSPTQGSTLGERAASLVYQSSKHRLQVPRIRDSPCLERVRSHPPQRRRVSGTVFFEVTKAAAMLRNASACHSAPARHAP